jgi:hypothetical protein
MPSNPLPAFDLITMGRSSIDLYANEVGAPFVDIKSFAALWAVRRPAMEQEIEN